ncbi:MAG: hypothetical protein HUJ56_06005, partial [Erysipelotrichaceae bacterium]|nr:hypothetical protein [Erysipelotrichaceae bacterium]
YDILYNFTMTAVGGAAFTIGVNSMEINVRRNANITGKNKGGWIRWAGGTINCGSGQSIVSYTVPAAETRYVYFNANGGEGGPGTQSYYYNSSGSITLSSTQPTR